MTEQDKEERTEREEFKKSKKGIIIILSLVILFSGYFYFTYKLAEEIKLLEDLIVVNNDQNTKIHDSAAQKNISNQDIKTITRAIESKINEIKTEMEGKSHICKNNIADERILTLLNEYSDKEIIVQQHLQKLKKLATQKLEEINNQVSENKNSSEILKLFKSQIKIEKQDSKTSILKQEKKLLEEFIKDSTELVANREYGKLANITEKLAQENEIFLSLAKNLKRLDTLKNKAFLTLLNGYVETSIKK